MIIDSRSCTDVASTTVLEKLIPNVMKYPHLYKLKWLNDQGVVRVTNEVLVPFSFGMTYNDRPLSDVVPVDASHLLLGR